MLIVILLQSSAYSLIFNSLELKDLYLYTDYPIYFISKYSLNGIILSDVRVCAQLYYELELKNSVTKFMYRPFISEPQSINKNCIHVSCFYVLARIWTSVPIRAGEPWSFLPPLKEYLYQIIVLYNLVYSDGYFFIINIS